MDTVINERPPVKFPRKRNGKRYPQAPRFGAIVTPAIRDWLVKRYPNRRMSGAVCDTALQLSLIEVMRYLSLEKRPPGEYKTIWVTVEPQLVERAAKYYIPPVWLLRAAAVKLYMDGKAEEAEKEREMPAKRA